MVRSGACSPQSVYQLKVSLRDQGGQRSPLCPEEHRGALAHWWGTYAVSLVLQAALLCDALGSGEEGPPIHRVIIILKPKLQIVFI